MLFFFFSCFLHILFKYSIFFLQSVYQILIIYYKMHVFSHIGNNFLQFINSLLYVIKNIEIRKNAMILHLLLYPLYFLNMQLLFL